jgi:hypothetical protein
LGEEEIRVSGFFGSQDSMFALGTEPICRWRKVFLFKLRNQVSVR